MASLAEVQLEAGDTDTAQTAFAAVEREVARVEAKYSRYRPDSALSAINRAAGGDPVAIDDETRALLDYADACFEDSEGRFDITSGVLRRAWNFASGIPPARETVDAWVALVGWTRVRRDRSTIALEAGMELDFGGIAKEYAADRAMSVAREAGIAHGFVNLGGDIRVIGPRANGDPWRAGIVHPRAVETTIAHVAVADGALATSGDYERYFEHGGRRYSHILDARTGWPVGGAPRSVTVLAPLCIVAGSCATIAMLHGRDAAAYLERAGVPYLLVDAAGRVTQSTSTTNPLIELRSSP